LGDRLITGLGGGIDGSLERLNRALGECLRAQLGKKSAQPEEHLDHYVHNSPEAIPVSVPQAFAKALYERTVQCLPAEDNSGGQQVNNVTGTITTADIRDDVNSRVIV
jgi:hypothetical protein